MAYPTQTYMSTQPFNPKKNITHNNLDIKVPDF